MWFAPPWQIGKPFAKVKTFMTRDAYVKLEKLGAVLLPPGAWVGYHKGSRQWQGFFDGSSKNLTCTHDGSTKRTESEALLRVVHGILTMYCEKHPKDKMWRSQLHKVDAINATVASL